MNTTTASPSNQTTATEHPGNATLYEKMETLPTRSAWSRGVKAYALEMVEAAEIDLTTLNRADLKQHLLNGARDWSESSYGGCHLIYDADIAERLCSPSELRKTRDGDRQPNSRESWLDVQARALSQAYRLIWLNI